MIWIWIEYICFCQIYCFTSVCCSVLGQNTKPPHWVSWMAALPVCVCACVRVLLSFPMRSIKCFPSNSLMCWFVSRKEKQLCAKSDNLCKIKIVVDADFQKRWPRVLFVYDYIHSNEPVAHSSNCFVPYCKICQALDSGTVFVSKINPLMVWVISGDLLTKKICKITRFVL